MADNSMRVKVSAEVSSFAADMHAATRDVDRFAGQVSRMGRTVSQTGSLASQAASSLSSLSSTLPGLVGGSSTVINAMGRTGMVLGDVTIASAVLTRSWALLSAAAPQLTAGIAAALPEIALVAAGVLLLAAAYQKLHTAQAPVSLMTATISDIGRPGRRPNPLLPAPAITAGAVDAYGRSDGPVKALENSTAAAKLAAVAVEEWQQAAQGIRPITTGITTDWALAMDSIATALKNTKDLTKDAISELYKMRDALLDVTRISAPLSLQDAAKQNSQLKTPGTRQGLRSLDPRQFLGSAMDKTPADFGLQQTDKLTNAFREGWSQVKDAIATQLPMRLAALIVGRTPAGAVGGALGGAFGTGVGSYIGKGLGAGIGGSIGTAVLPIIGSIAGAFIGSKIGDLFGRKHVDPAAAALDRLAAQAERLSASFSNLPQGFRVASYVYKYGAAHTDVPDTPRRTGMAGPIITIAHLTLHANSPLEFVRQISDASQMALARGGMSGFQLAISQAGRG